MTSLEVTSHMAQVWRERSAWCVEQGDWRHNVGLISSCALHCDACNPNPWTGRQDQVPLVRLWPKVESEL